MAYRDDADLVFLKDLKARDLDGLVQCLIYDKDGNKRYTEELSGNDNYKRFYPNHSMYWREIAAEIQTFGGNTFATLARFGKGVLYREVLTDVADKFKVNYNKKSPVAKIEQALLMKVLEDSAEKMSAEDLAALAKEAGIAATANLSKDALLAILMTAFKAGGFQSYKLSLMVANATLRFLIGRGLAFAGNAALTRSLSILTGPIGWAITTVWTAVDLADPAYRVTMPAVLNVAILRQQHEWELQHLREQFEKELGL
ncbi:DUF3944 domain-containing protein [Neisseria perflava]|uniref:DUF3944 domain-containing protein n=1 Tax=Neisseria perflava TaxID=33053 RepID=UPI0020A0863D|nr:DUF3944 domain-containing protein [Neisseria perflava]MCP1660861.1 uncharacterized protein YaaW (UPF0174 family) [Neisseria perflava]MCP1772496.1 uncharacterized protein YaaW (UPF0174 family) [Neisseria perflava]